ncbi:MAG: FeoA family protein [Brevinema sp.]
MSVCPALALLDKECKDCIAVIENLDNLDQQLQYQLTRLGICKGCPISLAQNTIFSDPIVFNINNSKVALRKKDAARISIHLTKIK